MKEIPDCRSIQFTLNRKTIVDQVAAFLYAAGLVHDNEDVLEIIFNSGDDINSSETVEIYVSLKKHQQVEVFTY